MKVIVQAEDETAENKEISINNEYFDVQGWVNLTVGDTTVEVHVSELHRACLPFLDEYYQSKED